MPNPFGITEVDVPGVLGAYEAGQTNRVRRLLYRQQAEAAERQAERQQRFDSILLGGGTEAKGGVQAAYSQAATPQAEQVVSDMHGLPAPGGPQAPAAASPATPAAPATQAVDIPPEVMRTLAVLDPERAGQIFTALNTMDTSQRARMAAANLYLANFAQHLRGVPLAQRAAEIQRRAPDLMAHGITQQQIAGFTPDDNSLDYVVQSAMDVERLAQVANPHPMEVAAGATVVDTNRRDARGHPNVLYESPIVMGPNNEPFTRPPSMSSQPAPRIMHDRTTGRTIQLNTETNQWEPVEEAPAFHPAPGGAASGQQNFPQ